MRNAIADLAVFLASIEIVRPTATPQELAEMRVMLAVKIERVRKQHGMRGVKPKATTLYYGETVEENAEA